MVSEAVPFLKLLSYLLPLYNCFPPRYHTHVHGGSPGDMLQLMVQLLAAKMVESVRGLVIFGGLPSRKKGSCD